MANSELPNSTPPHWAALAQRWALTGCPLRPTAPDLEGYQRFANTWIESHPTAPRVLLLGVTPELYQLPWPPARDFLAVDHTPAMLTHVWPGKPDEVCNANWTDLPLPTASRDIALCDGGLHLLDQAQDRETVVARLHDVIAPGGLVIIRLFMLPDSPESPSDVLSALLNRQIPNLNILKLRLGMALQSSSEAGDRVSLATVWKVLREAGGDWETLAPRIGWELDHLSVIDTYRDSPAHYAFTSLSDSLALFCSGGRFELIGKHTPDYPLGERCPVIALTRL